MAGRRGPSPNPTLGLEFGGTAAIIAIMNEQVTFAQLTQQFDSEWVLLADPVTNEGLCVESGTILWHSRDRDEVYRKARELRPRHSAILFLGQLPENTAVIL